MDSQLVTDDKIYCLYLADNAETIREHARRQSAAADFPQTTSRSSER